MEKIKQEKTMKKDGFTLIELIYVIVIIGIVTAIALPTINRTMRNRRGLLEGKAMILNAVLGAKSLASSGMDDWQLIFNGGGVNTISWKASDSVAVWRDDPLPRGCDFAMGGSLTFEFYRDGSAASLSPVDTFSIGNTKGERYLITLIPQIGEVRVNVH